ncbi:hypothetical protein VNI00_004464 [Paramarasmius palmivorus]|uniref:Uncharacterized protein n=1 Tax=Paramarasmius palmivorus TaxID=297713 RepID=A0AAW0DJV7_9AGAR
MTSPSPDLFDDVCHGKVKLDRKNAISFLESLCSHSKPIPTLLASSSGLDAFKRAMNTEYWPYFYNGTCCRVLLKLSQSEDEDDIRRVLAALANPPLFYISLFTAMTGDTLMEETMKWFAWLVLQHVSQPESLASSWSPLLKVYKDSPAVEALLRSSREDIRNIAEKIVEVAPRSAKAEEEEEDTKAGPGGRHDNDFEDFRAISVMPTPDELRCKKKPYFVPPSMLLEEKDPVKRQEVYLEMQFRLSHGQMMGLMRDEVEGMLEGVGEGSMMLDVDFAGLELNHPKMGHYWCWAFRCQEGSQTDTSGFQADFPLWLDGAVAYLVEGDEVLAFGGAVRDDEKLAQNPPVLIVKPFGGEAAICNALLRFNNDKPKRLLSMGRSCVPWAESLRRIRCMKLLPLRDELLSLSTTPQEPEHVPLEILRSFDKNEKCDVGQLLRFFDGSIILSEDQKTALQSALQERLCLIQGTPGTGKTLLASILAGILYQHTSQTILICCNSDDGLDHIMETVHKMVPSVQTTSFRDLPDLPQSKDAQLEEIADSISQDLAATFGRLQEAGQKREAVLEYLEANHPDIHAAFAGQQDNDTISLLDLWVSGKDGIYGIPGAEQTSDIWKTPVSEREALLQQWSQSMSESIISQIYDVAQRLDVAQDIMDRSKSQEIARELRSTRVLFCSYSDILFHLPSFRELESPDVFIFDDADSVVESCILPTLGAETKHIVLFGSSPLKNLQLQSSADSENRPIQVSLLERLMKNGYPHHSLHTQHPYSLPVVQPPPRNIWTPPLILPPVALPANNRDHTSTSSSTNTRSSTPSLPPLISKKVGQAEEEWKRRKSEFGADNIHVDAIMEMIGIEKVKQQILDIMDMVEATKQQKRSIKDFALNAVLLGNPGTGKRVLNTRLDYLLTLYEGICTFAGHYTSFLKSMDIIAMDYYREITSAEADDFMRHVADIQLGGVLHVVDAHAPGRYGYITWLNGSGMNSVSASSLADMMREGAGKRAFVFSGPKISLKKFLDNNPIVRDAFSHAFYFEDYTIEDLTVILEQRLRETFKEAEMEIEGGIGGNCVRLALKRLIARHGNDTFRNANSLETFLEEVLRRQTRRLAKEHKNGGNPNYNLITKEDLLDREDDSGLEDALKELDKLVGMRAVKQSVQSLVKLAQINEKRELQGKKAIEILLNRVFLGPPGTGKTTVANVYAKILKRLGYLSRGDVITKHATNLIGQFIGQSEVITKETIASAAGSVLIIDEAHVLNPKNDNDADCFKEAVIDTLVSCVHNTPGDDQCIILIGYEDEMLEMFRNANPGLARRFRNEEAFRFENLDQQQLLQIFDLKLSEDQLSVTPAARAVAAEMLELARHRPNFGNGGEVVNLISSATQRYYGRFALDEFPDAVVLEPGDFDPDYGRSAEASERLAALFADMVGCEEIMKKLGDFQRISHTMRVCGKDARKVIPMNFVFKGPPGTGKTTVARKMGHVFYDMGMLSSPEVIECSASDMIGKYVGHTGPKTRELFERALGKVLFIDEAYRLGQGCYAEEAIGELVTLLTLKTFRGKMVVILAGYDWEMDRLLSCNRGLSSRFPEQIIFDNTDPDSCLAILRLELAKHGVALSCLSERKSRGYRSMAEVILNMSRTRAWGNARDMVSLSIHLVREAHKEPPNPRTKTFEVAQKIALKHLMAMREEQSRRASHNTATRVFTPPSFQSNVTTANGDLESTHLALYASCQNFPSSSLYGNSKTIPNHKDNISSKCASWWKAILPFHVNTVSVNPSVKDNSEDLSPLIFVSWSLALFASTFVLVGIAALDVMQDLEDLTFQFASMLQVQRVDFEDFDKVDFDDYKQTAAYFSDICTPFLVTPQYAEEDAVKAFFDHLKDFAFMDDAGLKDKIQETMRSAAREVHELLKDTKEKPVESAQEVSRILRDAIVMVILGLEMNADEKLAAVMKAFKDRENEKPPPPKEKEKGYDLIG